MANDRATVVVTITEYTTLHPTSLPTLPVSETIPSLTRSSRVRTPSHSSINNAPHSKSFKSSMSASPSKSFETSILSSFTPSTKPSSSLRVSASTSATSGVASSTGLPTGWPKPSPAPQQTEKHPDNTLPILFLLWLIFIALFFLGALVYFAVRLARGRCVSCSMKNEELVYLKTRLTGQERVTPRMVRNRETLNPQVENPQMERGDNDVEHEAVPVTGHAERSGPGELNNNNVANQSRFSATTIEADYSHSLHQIPNRSLVSRSMELHRAKVLQELEEEGGWNEQPLKSAPAGKTFSDPGLAPAPPMLAASYQRPENPNPYSYKPAVPKPAGRTFSNPGLAPAPPVIATPAPAYHRSTAQRPTNPNPYSYNPVAAYFNAATTGRSKTNSGRGSSDAVPAEYSKPRAGFVTEEHPTSQTGFITVSLDSDPPSQRQDQEEERRVRAEKRRNKRRTGGYGGLSPIVPEDIYPEGMD